MRKEFYPYIKMVDFLGEALGNSYCVEIYDVDNLSEPVMRSNGDIKMENSSLISDILSSELLKNNDFLCSSIGDPQTGEKKRFSVFYIRDDSEKITGVLCIHEKREQLFQVRDVLENIMAPDDEDQDDEQNPQSLVVQQIGKEVDSLLEETVEKTLEKLGLTGRKLKAAEKQDVVESLLNQGFFGIKGAVAQAAKTMNISVPSIYRYINKVLDSELTGE